MANLSSFSILEKLDSVPNGNEQSSAPIFKIPSPFWNQDSVFRRSRHVRESTPDVVTDAFALYPYSCDLASVPNSDLSGAAGVNQIYPALSMNPVNASSRYLPPAAKFSMTDPKTRHSIGRGAYYWSYLTSDIEDGVAKGFRNMHNPQIDPFLASYYYRDAVRDVLRRDIPHEEIKTGLQKERPRGEMYWNHIPQKQRIRHRSKKDPARHYVKNNPLLGSLLHTGSSQNSHDQLTLNPSGPAVPEESKWDSKKQTGEDLPLLDWREAAEQQHQERNPGTCPTPSSSALCVLHRFIKGSLVELEGGRLKRVEDLQMEDLEHCAELHSELRLECFTVLKITPSHTPAFLLQVELEHDHSQLSLEVNEGLPLFVCGQGWSSCSPQHTRQACRLQCHQLRVGDRCLALTRDPAPPVQPANESAGEVTPAQPANESAGEVCAGHTAPKCDTEKKSTLPRKDKSRRRHFTAPELRDLSRVHHATD